MQKGTCNRTCSRIPLKLYSLNVQKVLFPDNQDVWSLFKLVYQASNSRNAGIPISSSGDNPSTEEGICCECYDEFICRGLISGMKSMSILLSDLVEFCKKLRFPFNLE